MEFNRTYIKINSVWSWWRADTIIMETAKHEVHARHVVCIIAYHWNCEGDGGGDKGTEICS